MTTEYLLTGELKKTYGSRTYPVEYTYDYSGRMKTMKTWQDYTGNSGTATTTWNYDPYRGWLTSKTYQGGVSGPTYTYTPAGRLASRIWARGITTWYANNAAGDLWTIVYSDGTTPNVTNTYDRRGRLTQQSTSAYQLNSIYNDANQLLSESYTGGPLGGLAVTNVYDTLLRRATNGVWNGAAWLAQTRYTYDTASRLLTAGDGASTAGYTYLANSPLVGQITFTNNGVQRMVTTKQYDFLNRLTSISSVGGASSASPISFNYSYNNANQRIRTVLADGSFWIYEYDSLGQVKSGKRYWPDWTPVAGQQFEYGHDDIGNRTQTKAGGDASGQNLRTNSYTPNNLNQYTQRTVLGTNDVIGVALATNSVTVNGVMAYRKVEYFQALAGTNNASAPAWLGVTVSSGGQSVTGHVLVAQSPESFTYDADGNLTSDSLWTNTWNAENRLLATESRSSVPAAARAREEWTYLPDGRWIQRIVSTNNGSAYYTAFTNRYAWDGQVLLAVLDHTNGLVMSFMRGLDVSGTLQGAGGVGGVLAVSFKTNGTHFTCYDGNGNVSALVNAADGSESARYEYGPFGEPIRVTGPLAKLNPIRFSTQYADDVTGDLKYLHRDYRPDLGRWKSRDPIGELGFKAITGIQRWGYAEELLLFRFVGNNPIGTVDWLGLASNPCGTDECKCLGCIVFAEARGKEDACQKAFFRVHNG